MAPKKKEPICSNCYECGHIGKNCPDRPFVFYSNRKFPKVTLIQSKTIPKKINEDCSLCGQTLNTKDKTVVETACKHYFHNECLAIRWGEERPKANCPTCNFDYTIDMGDGEIKITHNANDVFRRTIAENQYADDVESQKRHLTDTEIEQLLRQEDPYHRWDEDEKDFLRAQLKSLTYDKKYHGYYSTDVSIGLYDQARDRIQEWNRGGTEEDHFQPVDKDALAALSEEFFQKGHPELVGEVMSYLKPKDDPNVKKFYEEQLKNEPPPPAKSSKKSNTKSSKKPSPGLGGAKTRKRNKPFKN
jgi:hypothetical protein